MQAFVTGATGLLGNTLVRQLVEQEHDVKALVRSPEKADRLLGDLAVDIVVGDMRDVEAFEHELEGCEVLFHTAAYFREYYQPGDHWETLQAVNVDGTIRLLEAADRRSIMRAVHVSSAGFIGQDSHEDLGDESSPPSPRAEDNLYLKSKLLAEEAIDAFLETHDLPVILVLPGWMFGPYDAAPTNSGRLVLDLAQGDMMGIFDGGNMVVDARDVAHALVTAAEIGQSGERYIVAGQYVTLQEIATTIASITGSPVPRMFPYPLVAVFARILEMYGRLTGRSVSLTRDGVATLRSPMQVTSAKAERELGVTFRPFEETLRDEIEWYATNGWPTLQIDDTQPRSAPSELGHNVTKEERHEP